MSTREAMDARELRKIVSFGALLVACAGATACAVEPAEGADTSAEPTGQTSEAITNGSDDSSDLGVVALLAKDKIVCTGFLVTTHVVVTAAHCVDESTPDTVYFGADPRTKKGTFIAIADTKLAPKYDPATLADDVAVIGLSEAAPTPPVAVLSKPFDATFQDLPIRLVGFGATAGGAGALRKHVGMTSIDSFADENFQFSPSPAQICDGDSGGPAFATIAGKEVVVGITSSGDTSCASSGSDMRMDVFYKFVSGYAKTFKAPAEPAAGCAVSRGSGGGGSGSGSAPRAALVGLACAIAFAARRSRRRTS